MMWTLTQISFSAVTRMVNVVKRDLVFLFFSRPDPSALESSSDEEPEEVLPSSSTLPTEHLQLPESPQPPERSPQPSTSGVSKKQSKCKTGGKKYKTVGKKTKQVRAKKTGKTKSKKKGKQKTKNKKDKPKIPWVHASILSKKIPFDKENEKLSEDIMTLDTPYAFFKYFFNDTLMRNITQESNLYLVQQDPNTNKSVTLLELQKILGILIMMSIVRLPNVRNYWKDSIGNQTIIETMGVNKFEFIRSILHFSDNHKAIPRGQPGHDRLYKLRPVVEELRSKFKSVALEQKLCVDEQMCATKAKNYLRQYLPKKTHKWGYKIYVLSGVSGFAYDFEIYTGQENNETLRLPGEPDLGSCANVVVRLTRCVSPQNHQIYFDNFYTSLPLIVHLAKKNIHALGTVRRDRIPGNKLPSETELKEKERGFSAENCVQVDEVEVSCVVWKDNKSVT
ncbi:piggyBac transposable element-derived protein 3-like [Macrosteles quadrilineatus]|uniref:piggyBac transposable element-derived protein 3-like n=1 Tax=Macrosteles quadrilineatus TaxID=74068 RepID=UPI0023E1E6BA|nr:piggyBac transposable element-derived protein 3-like [Macrosteles quadrilineatus]